MDIWAQVLLVVAGGALPLTGQAVGAAVKNGREKRAAEARAREDARNEVKRAVARTRLAWIDCISSRAVKPLSNQHARELLAALSDNMREFMEVSTSMMEYGGELEATSMELFNTATLPASQDVGHKKLTRAVNAFQDAAGRWLKAHAEDTGEKKRWRIAGKAPGTEVAQTAPQETHTEGNGTDETGDASK